MLCGFLGKFIATPGLLLLTLLFVEVIAWDLISPCHSNMFSYTSRLWEKTNLSARGCYPDIKPNSFNSMERKCVVISRENQLNGSWITDATTLWCTLLVTVWRKNHWIVIVLTIVFILDEIPFVPAALETGQVRAQPQVCKYFVLLYNSTKYNTNNAQKKYKYHNIIGQMVILYYEKPV